MIYAPRRKKPYLLIFTLIILFLALSLPPLRNLTGVRRLLDTIVYPFQFTLDIFQKGLRTTVSYVITINSAAVENIGLKQKLKETQIKLGLLDEALRENERMQKALDYVQTNASQMKLIAARVVGKSPSPWFSKIIIDKGGRAGIRKDLAVVTQDGLAGRIIEVYPFSSKVRLIIDAESSVAVINQRSRDYGVAEGALPNRLYLRFVDAKGDIKSEDIIVTSNISDIFPAGVVVGEVLNVSKNEYDLFYHIELKPKVNFSKLEEVFVIVN